MTLETPQGTQHCSRAHFIYRVCGSHLSDWDARVKQTGLNAARWAAVLQKKISSKISAAKHKLRPPTDEEGNKLASETNKDRLIYEKKWLKEPAVTMISPSPDHHSTQQVLASEPNLSRVDSPRSMEINAFANNALLSSPNISGVNLEPQTSTSEFKEANLEDDMKKKDDLIEQLRAQLAAKSEMPDQPQPNAQTASPAAAAVIHTAMPPPNKVQSQPKRGLCFLLKLYIDTTVLQVLIPN